MIHYLNLWPNPFKMIKLGIKTIEMRLNDEKRSLIKIGDFIEFENKETHEKLTCEVINIYKYSSFEELYKHHDKTSLGYFENEEAKPSDMNVYYSQEKRDKYGVLGIEIKKVL